MPRTVDHIVETNKLAQARKNKGLPIWDKTVKVKDVMQTYNRDAEELHAEISRIALAVGARFRNTLPESFFKSGSADYNEEMVMLVELLEGATTEYLEKQDGEYGQDPVELFDGWMEQLFDWADIQRVWLA